MQIIVITYYNFGQKYTEEFSIDQAKKELKNQGIKTKNLSFEQIGILLSEIFNP